MTEREYRALDAVNWSTLKAMADSPLHYSTALAEGRKDTDAMAFGRVVDCLIFAPDELDAKVAVSPYDDFKTKEARAWRDATKAAGMDVVKDETLDEARKLAAAVRRHPVARRYLDAGKFQVPLVWIDKETGLLCKGLSDLIGHGFIMDGKSTVNAGKRKYLRDFAKMKYHCQLAHYRNGYRATYGSDPETIGHIVYEKGAPYDVGVFAFDSYIIDAGENEVREYLRKVAECRASGVWPGRYPDLEHVTDQDVPAYIYGDESDDVTVTTIEE